MPEATQFQYSHKELITLILKDQKIHEGLWSLMVSFGLGAGNTGPSEADLNPSAIAQVVGIGIQRGTSLNNITVDAAKENPKPKIKKN